MSTYSYIGLRADGRRIRGVLEADSARHARQLLRQRQLVPVDVIESEQERRPGRRGGYRPKTAELALFTRQLATLMAAGIPVEEALGAVAQQTEKPRMGALISAVRSQVLTGNTLANGMGLYPEAFNDLYRAMVAAGEKSGRLDTVLNRLADYTEQQHKLKSRLIQALIYPMVLTTVAIGVITILLVTVVPNVVEQFTYMKQTLPLSTRILMAVSDLVQRYGPVMLILLMVVGWQWLRWLKKPINHRRYHGWLIRLPVIGRISCSVNTARFARTLSILNASAVPLLDAIRISGEVLNNLEARARIESTREAVREGSSLYGALEQSRLFPPMMLHMVASGERSGELDNMLERAADNQDNEFESRIAMTLSLFEPVLVIGMAVTVLFIVLAILQPILQLNNMVSY